MHKYLYLEKQQLCVEVPLEHGLHLQVLLIFLERLGGKLFPPKIYEQVNQAIWADESQGIAVNIQPVKINLKEGLKIARKKQYFLTKEGLGGIQPVLQKLLKSGLIQPCQSPYNTPILPVKKSPTLMNIDLYRILGP